MKPHSCLAPSNLPLQKKKGQRAAQAPELLAYNPKYAKDYMRKIGLPQEEANLSFLFLI